MRTNNACNLDVAQYIADENTDAKTRYDIAQILRAYRALGYNSATLYAASYRMQKQAGTELFPARPINRPIATGGRKTRSYDPAVMSKTDTLSPLPMTYADDATIDVPALLTLLADCGIDYTTPANRTRIVCYLESMGQAEAAHEFLSDVESGIAWASR